MVFACTVLLAIASGVSCSADAITVKDLVGALAAESKQDLRCDVTLRNEPLIVQFENQPLETVMEQIAKVTGAEWVVIDKARVLKRTVPAGKAEQASERDRLLLLAGKMQKELGARVGQLPKFDASQAEELCDASRYNDASREFSITNYIRLGEINPLNRFAVASFLRFSPADLLKFPLEKRIVFSDVPNQMQRPLTANPGALDELRRGITLVEKATDKFKSRVPYGSVPEVGYGRLSGNGYGKVLFGLTRRGPATFHYMVQVIDGAGYVATKVESDFPDMNTILGAVPPETGKALELSPLTKDFCSLTTLRGMSMGMTTPIVMPDRSIVYANAGITMSEAKGFLPSPELKAALREPTKVDPVGIVLGGPLRQFATSQKQSLIASIPDEAVFAAAMSLGRKPNLTDDGVLGLLDQSMVPEYARVPYTIKEASDGWLTFRPFAPSFTRASRVDRAALQKLMEHILSTSGVSLRSAADYYATRRMVPNFRTLDRLYMDNIDEAMKWGAIDLAFNAALPFVASLSPTQWRSVEAGELKWQNLTPTQKDILLDWMGSFDGKFQLERSKNGKGPQEIFAKDTEMTELLGRGVPADAAIRMTKSSLPAILAQADSGFRYLLDAPTLALQETKLGKIQNWDGKELKRNFVGFRPAVFSNYDIFFDLPTVSLKLTFRETTVEPGTWRKRGQLPSEFLKRVDQLKEILKNRSE
jgi:hypothetical protein